eukprot:Ihof_evm2s541 gene=Ihof_evmTU2s541
MWPEIELVKSNHRFELRLSGPEVCKRVQEAGLDENVFLLDWLNTLELSGIGITTLSSKVNLLANLLVCDLSDNLLVTLPEELGQLPQLRTLSLKNNQLASIPFNLSQAQSLHTLNLSLNNLSDLPDELGSLSNLTILDISNNCFESLPSCIYSLRHLSDLHAQHNKITAIEPEIGELDQLKCIDLSDNQLQTLPAALASCLKLKDVNFKENPFKQDRRLGKLVQAGKVKPILEYVRTTGTKAGSGKKGISKAAAKTTATKGAPLPDNDGCVKIRILKTKDSPLLVHANISHVKGLRQYITSCVIKAVSLAEPLFDEFIKLQTRLHQGICNKRTTATIGTHDNSLCEWPLVYDALPSDQCHITPLREDKELSFKQLLKRYANEGAILNQYSKLVGDRDAFPCLFDGSGRCMSFPPFTNAEFCKISPSTQDIFI